MATLPNLLTHQQLRALVEERIRKAILDGDYRPGVWLRQQRVAQELGVSQMPVREALKALAAEGLVEHVPYRGVRVIEISQEDVADLYAHRAFLEARAAYYAARHISEGELANLKQIQAQIIANQAAEQLALYRQLNRQFHELIFRASRRPYLVRTLSQMWSTFPSMLWGNFAQTAVQPLPARDDLDLQEHAAILEALSRHDAEAAARQMERHIRQAGEELAMVLQTSRARVQA